MKRYHFIVLAIVVFSLALAACQGSPEEASTTALPEVPTATLAPTLVPTDPPPTLVPTKIPRLIIADDYCPTGNMSTDWCVCADIVSTGPIGALRNATNTEPHETMSTIGHIIEILVHENGEPHHIERYDWSSLLTSFNTTLHSGDIVCDAFRPTVSEVHTDLEVTDYRERP